MNMLNVIIREDQRAVLYRDGRPVEILGPGRHRRFGWGAEQHIETIDPLRGLADPHPAVEKLLDPAEVTLVEVPEDHVALVARLGKAYEVLPTGRYALWHNEAALQVDIADLAPLRTAVPRRWWGELASIITDLLVAPYERVLVYDDGVLADVLGAGRYGLSTHRRKLTMQRVDLREAELQIVGQEIMTRDKVTLRLNLVLKHRIVDPVAAVHATADLRDALYAEVQLAARAEVAGVEVDALLEGRNALAVRLVETVAPRAKAWGVEILRLEIKDIVLPGEMKTLLNQVIEANKRAEANNILRREEVAATRSLANTARLLESNPVLRRLKEVEAIRDIADRIPNLTVVVAPKDLQAHLRLGDE